jgi:hypothetical protein
MAREIIAVAIDAEVGAFDVTLGTMTLPGTVDAYLNAHLNAALTAWLQADLEAGRAAQELRDSGVNVADIGRLLGVSRVIARKLLANADGVDTARALVARASLTSRPTPTNTGTPTRKLRRRPPGMAGSRIDAAGALARADAAVAASAADTVDGGTDVDAWAELGPFYDTAAVAGVLGVSMSAVRSRRARGNLFALRTGSGSWVYPAWQFDHGGQVLPGLGPVLRVLAGGDVSAWALASWLRSPEVELSGRTPFAVLHTGAEDELVLLVASHAAAGWAK